MLAQIAINDFSSTLKDLQTYDSSVAGIQNKDILPGDKLPSVFEVCVEFDVSKRMVERACDLLKEKQLIDSTKGKGSYTYISNLEVDRRLKVFLLFNELSPHKKLIYDACTGESSPDTVLKPAWLLILPASRFNPVMLTLT